MKFTLRHFVTTLLAGSFLAAVSAPAQAQYHHDHGYDHDHGYGGWHGDIHHFREYDLAYWHGGRWINGFHSGRAGWWWIVGGVWYYYPAPVYPYPDPFIPPGAPVAGPPGQYVYYCPNPAGYFPYVAQCFGPWQPMPQAVPQPVAPAYAPPPGPPPGYGAQPQGRDMDDRQLNNFAVEYNTIHTSSPGAAAHLDDLHGRIEAFRQSLYSRPYNVMDIMQDTEKLEKRVAKKRAHLHVAAPVVAPSYAPPAPPPY